MASDFFRVERGYEIADSNSTLVQIITATAAPDAQADAVAAPIGTLWVVNGGTAATTLIYQKWSTAQSTYIDWREINTTASWREPAKLRDNTLYANSAAFPTGGTIDGVAVVDGDRVLFSNVTAATDRNIWIWYAATTTWFEESNAETKGDVVFIQAGTSANNFYYYDGTNWVAFGSGSAAEEGFIRAFIGKDAAGSETPNYTNPTGGGPFTLGNIIGNTDNLELAIAKLNAWVYDDTAELTTANVSVFTDTLLSGKNMALWLIRANGNADPTRVRARMVFAIRNNANAVDFASFTLLSSGGNVTGLAFDVTSAGTALTLSVTSTLNMDVEIKRVAVM